MSVNTKTYILKYKNSEFVAAEELELPIRQDDAIYGYLWDEHNYVSNEEEATLLKFYDLDDEEYEKLIFHNYWCEDLLETTDEEDEDAEYENNFSLVPLDKVMPVGKLLKLLKKVSRMHIERAIWAEDEFFKNLNNAIKSAYSPNTCADIIKNAENSLRNAQDGPFILLIGSLLGRLSQIKKDPEIDVVQIIFYQY